MRRVQVIWAMAGLYALGAFFAGFGLGALRILVLTPLTGPVIAVMVELPVMLFISLAICRAILSQDWASRALSHRAAMGVAAFALLMTLEMLVGLLLFQQPVSGVFAALAAPAGLLGLAGQVLFALLPLLPTAAKPEPATQATEPFATA